MAVLSPNLLNIKLNPQKELRFTGDFREASAVNLTLTNPGRVPVLYKVRIENILKKNLI